MTGEWSKKVEDALLTELDRHRRAILQILASAELAQTLTPPNVNVDEKEV
jgi:hypothetical protein